MHSFNGADSYTNRSLKYLHSNDMNSLKENQEIMSVCVCERLVP